MFDFSAKKTQESIKKSLERLKLNYVDVLQVTVDQKINNIDLLIIL